MIELYLLAEVYTGLIWKMCFLTTFLIYLQKYRLWNNYYTIYLLYIYLFNFINLATFCVYI